MSALGWKADFGLSPNGATTAPFPHGLPHTPRSLWNQEPKNQSTGGQNYHQVKTVSKGGHGGVPMP